jgi:hypothetical protein
METFLKILGVFFDPAIWVIAVVISSIVTFVVWHFEKAAEHSVQRTGERVPRKCRYFSNHVGGRRTRR